MIERFLKKLMGKENFAVEESASSGYMPIISNKQTLERNPNLPINADKIPDPLAINKELPNNSTLYRNAGTPAKTQTPGSPGSPGSPENYRTPGSPEKYQIVRTSEEFTDYGGIDTTNAIYAKYY